MGGIVSTKTSKRAPWDRDNNKTHTKKTETHLFRQSWKQGIKQWFVACADFCGINTPIVANFKSLVWYHCKFGNTGTAAYPYVSPPCKHTRCKETQEHLENSKM